MLRRAPVMFISYSVFFYSFKFCFIYNCLETETARMDDKDNDFEFKVSFIGEN